MKFNELYKLMTEMALTDMKKIGKWDDTKNRHGYDKQSIGILNSQAGYEKIRRTFDNINLADFNLYFVKDTNAWKSRELGKQTPEEIEQKTGLNLGEQPDYDPDSITIVFTNNSAAEKVPLTPWLIAHRIGHAMIRSYRSSGGSDPEFKTLYSRVGSAVSKILKFGYGVNANNPSNSFSTPLHRSLFESLGKFRSARMKKLPRPEEFLYECFAQYLLANGHLELNDLPKTLIDSNKKAWGNSTGRNYSLMIETSEAEQLLWGLESALSNLFYYWVQDHTGTTSIM